jgi:hypothetical protein
MALVSLCMRRPSSRVILGKYEETGMARVGTWEQKERM